MSILLIFHIAISVAMTAVSVALFGAGVIKSKQQLLRHGVVGSWLMSAGSGIGLLFGGASLLHFCVTMSAFSLVALAAERFYVHRLKNVTSLV